MTSESKEKGNMTTTTSRILKGSCMAFIISGFLVAQQLPPTAKKTTERIQGSSSSTTKEISGTVVSVEGNTLVVRLSTGEIETFNPPDSRKLLIGGQEVSVHELKVGTRLHAKQTVTQTSVTERTRATLTGKVWYVAGPNVILTLPNGENHQFKVKDDFKLIVDGRPATVFELKKGMTVTAE